MVARAQLVAEARSWVGTPFAHQGRRKRVGVDCVGLVIGLAHAFGISNFDVRNYPRFPNPQMMRALLDEHMDRISFKSVLPADVIHLRPRASAQHLAVVTDTEPVTIVHAYSRGSVSRCLEEPLGEWVNRVDGCYRFRTELT